MLLDGSVVDIIIFSSCFLIRWMFRISIEDEPFLDISVIGFIDVFDFVDTKLPAFDCEIVRWISNDETVLIESAVLLLQSDGRCIL